MQKGKGARNVRRRFRAGRSRQRMMLDMMAATAAAAASQLRSLSAHQARRPLALRHACVSAAAGSSALPRGRPCNTFAVPRRLRTVTGGVGPRA